MHYAQLFLIKILLSLFFTGIFTEKGVFSLTELYVDDIILYSFYINFISLHLPI